VDGLLGPQLRGLKPEASSSRVGRLIKLSSTTD
jgi:hypothetical protein